MVLGLFRRPQLEPPVDAYGSVPEPELHLPFTPDPQTILFDGLTADQRIIGEIVFAGRLSDALNGREPLPINNVRVASIDDENSFLPAPAYGSIDPYDFELVVLGPDSLPGFSAEQREAHKIRKAPHSVKIDLAPYRVTGTIWLDLGTTIEVLLGRITRLYLPVTGAQVMLGERVIDLRGSDTVLVNLFDLREIKEQVD